MTQYSGFLSTQTKLNQLKILKRLELNHRVILSEILNFKSIWKINFKYWNLVLKKNTFNFKQNCGIGK